MSLAFILTMATATFVVRVFTPSGTSIANIHPGDLPQYALMFAAGILAARGKWLERPLPHTMLRMSLAVLVAAGAIWIFIVAWALTPPHDTNQLDGGLIQTDSISSRSAVGWCYDAADWDRQVNRPVID